MKRTIIRIFLTFFTMAVLYYLALCQGNEIETFLVGLCIGIYTTLVCQFFRNITEKTSS